MSVQSNSSATSRSNIHSVTDAVEVVVRQQDKENQETKPQFNLENLKRQSEPIYPVVVPHELRVRPGDFPDLEINPNFTTQLSGENYTTSTLLGKTFSEKALPGPTKIPVNTSEVVDAFHDFFRSLSPNSILVQYGSFPGFEKDIATGLWKPGFDISIDESWNPDKKPDFFFVTSDPTEVLEKIGEMKGWGQLKLNMMKWFAKRGLVFFNLSQKQGNAEINYKFGLISSDFIKARMPFLMMRLTLLLLDHTFVDLSTPESRAKMTSKQSSMLSKQQFEKIVFEEAQEYFKRSLDIQAGKKNRFTLWDVIVERYKNNFKGYEIYRAFFEGNKYPKQIERYKNQLGRIFLEVVIKTLEKSSDLYELQDADGRKINLASLRRENFTQKNLEKLTVHAKADLATRQKIAAQAKFTMFAKIVPINLKQQVITICSEFLQKGLSAVMYLGRKLKNRYGKASGGDASYAKERTLPQNPTNEEIKKFQELLSYFTSRNQTTYEKLLSDEKGDSSISEILRTVSKAESILNAYSINSKLNPDIPRLSVIEFQTIFPFLIESITLARAINQKNTHPSKKISNYLDSVEEFAYKTYIDITAETPEGHRAQVKVNKKGQVTVQSGILSEGGVWQILQGAKPATVLGNKTPLMPEALPSIMARSAGITMASSAQQLRDLPSLRISTDHIVSWMNRPSSKNYLNGTGQYYRDIFPNRLTQRAPALGMSMLVMGASPLVFEAFGMDPRVRPHETLAGILGANALISGAIVNPMWQVYLNQLYKNPYAMANYRTINTSAGCSSREIKAAF